MIRLKKLDSIRNSQDNNIYGKFSILPLVKGHGLTVGNALRRTLLSDLSGIAITALKIGGVEHKLANSNSIRTGTDFIEMDAVFTPIQRVNYYVENIYTKPRLLKENLIFEIWTNGSITPDCAIKNASEILINLFSIFIVSSATPKQNLVLESKTNILIEELNLSVRAYNCLKSAQIHSLEDLMQYSLNDLEKIKSFGQKSLVEVVTKLKNNYGIILKN